MPEPSAHNAMTRAMIDAKNEMGPVLKDKTNPAFRSKYADLGAVLDAVEPALLKYDILLSQAVTYEDGWTHMILETTLRHVEGGRLVSTYRIKPVKDDPQGEGSALTYARRYAVLALLSIAPEDDDGRAAAAKPVQPSKDWVAEAKKLNTADGVRNLYRLAKSKGELTDDMAGALKDRVLELEAPVQDPSYVTPGSEGADSE